MGFTNRGCYLLLGYLFRLSTRPANLNLILWTSAVVPTVDTNVAGDATEVTNGNGYTTNGQSVALNATDVDTWTEDDTGNYAFVQLKDYAWTATGAGISSIRYPALVDDNATPASRQVFVWWDLGSTITLTSGQTLTIQNAEARLTPA
jgi:hypothetical protein